MWSIQLLYAAAAAYVVHIIRQFYLLLSYTSKEQANTAAV